MKNYKEIKVTVNCDITVVLDDVSEDMASVLFESGKDIMKVYLEGQNLKDVKINNYKISAEEGMSDE